MVLADPTGVIPCLVIQTDVLLVSKRDLRIRDNGGEKDRMGGFTLRAFEPADTKTKRSLPPLYGSFVVAVN